MLTREKIEELKLKMENSIDNLATELGISYKHQDVEILNIGLEILMAEIERLRRWKKKL